MITGFTKYFVDKWVKKFGGEPLLDTINSDLENNALRVQPFLIFYNKKKDTLQRVLACYWIPDKDLMVKVDLETKSAVTFYVPSDINELEKE